MQETDVQIRILILELIDIDHWDRRVKRGQKELSSKRVTQNIKEMEHVQVFGDRR